MIRLDLPVMTRSYFEWLMNSARRAISYYNARYFDEPFVEMCANMIPEIRSVRQTTQAEDREHIDLVFQIDNLLYKVDVKTVTFNYYDRKSGTYGDYLTIGEFVFKDAPFDLMIGCVYKSKIYMIWLNKFRGDIAPAIVNKKSKGTNGSKQDMFRFDMNTVIRNADIIYDIPEKLYSVYEKEISVYHHYDSKYNSYWIEKILTPDDAEFFDGFRVELLDVIKECNNIYLNRIHTGYYDDKMSDICSSADDALAELNLLLA